MFDLPRIPLGEWIDEFVNWLQTTFAGLFRGVRSLGDTLLGGLMDGLGWPDPVIFAVVVALLAFWLRGWGFGLFTLVSFLLIASMELWTQMVQTLSLILLATLIAVAVALPVGIIAARNDTVSTAVRPVLDFMQTMPVFVYLLPAVAFFRIGFVAGMFATLVFAIPPGVRLTELGIRQVDTEVVEAAEAYGANKRQLLFGVQLPMAMPSIMQGVNQVIMLALSMVVVAALIGARGLGGPVVRGVQRVDLDIAFEGGLAVVILAIFLDRITSAFRDRQQVEA